MSLFDEMALHFGEDIALQICAKFQGKHYYFPRLASATHFHPGVKLASAIRDLFSRGYSVYEIGRMKGLQPSTVISVLEASMTQHVSSTREKYEGQLKRSQKRSS